MCLIIFLVLIKLLAAVIHRTVLQIAIFGYTQDSNLTDRKA